MPVDVQGTLWGRLAAAVSYDTAAGIGAIRPRLANVYLHTSSISGSSDGGGGRRAAALVRLWRATLKRRSQTGFVPWTRMRRLKARWLPGPRICHPYPNQRLAFVTQGRSRMR